MNNFHETEKKKYLKPEIWKWLDIITQVAYLITAVTTNLSHLSDVFNVKLHIEGQFDVMLR